MAVGEDSSVEDLDPPKAVAACPLVQMEDVADAEPIGNFQREE
jgi:hypothetical protein